MRDRLLDVLEAAAMLGRSENAVRRMVERRQIPYRKAGRRVMFLESELQALIDALPGLSLEDLQEREKAGMCGEERGEKAMKHREYGASPGNEVPREARMRFAGSAATFFSCDCTTAPPPCIPESYH